MQEEAIEATLDPENEVAAPAARRPLSRNRLVWLRLKTMPRFWVAIASAASRIWRRGEVRPLEKK